MALEVVEEPLEVVEEDDHRARLQARVVRVPAPSRLQQPVLPHPVAIFRVRRFFRWVIP